MKYTHHYGGLIWTNHAIERMRDRGLKQELAWEAFKNPDWSGEAREPGSTKYEKQYSGSRITLIAKQNERNEWIVISSWIDPPTPGSIDWRKRENYKKFQKAGFWGKMLLTLKAQLGF